MIAGKLKDRIASLVTHVTFEYDGLNCGVDPLSTTHFDMWYGDDFMTAKSIEEVMDSPFFKGKSLKDIADDIVIVDW